MSQTTTADPATTTTAAPTTAASAAPATTTAAPTTATADAPKTALTSTGDDGKGAPAGSAWREDWRDAMAAADPASRQRLERMQSPEAVWTSYRALEQKLSSGEYKPTLPADAKPEEVAAWRTANGIPDKPEGYLEKLPAGLVIGDADLPVVQDFLAVAHADNATPKQAHNFIQWHYKNQEAQGAKQAEADTAYLAATEDALRAEWGPEYRANQTATVALIQTLAPKGVLEKLNGARMDGGGGRMLLADADVMRFMAGLAREINPAATVVPGAGASAGAGIAERKQAMEKMMGDRGSEYWKGPKAAAMQAEYRQLIEAEQRQAARA